MNNATRFRVIGTSVMFAGCCETGWFGLATVLRALFPNFLSFLFGPGWTWGTNLFPPEPTWLTVLIGVTALALWLLGIFIKPEWFRIPAGLAACVARFWQSWQVKGVYACGVWVVLVAAMFFAEWAWPRILEWRDRTGRPTW